MDPFTLLVLPQNDTPTNRAARKADLAKQQAAYRYDYPDIVAGLPMAAAPIPVDLSVDWVVGVVQIALAVGENLVDLVLPNVLDFDIQLPITLGGKATQGAGTRKAAPSLPPLEGKIQEEAARFRGFLDRTRGELSARIAATQAAPSLPQVVPPLLAAVEAFAPSRAEPGAHLLADAESWLKSILDEIAQFLGKLVGAYGRAGDLQGYAQQFRTLPLPWSAGVYQTDEMFAQMRVVGPNPVMLRRADRADLAPFGLDDDRLRRLTGQPEASINRALAAGALYLVDYKDLESLVPGTDPLPKYVFAPRALFHVPEDGDRALRPLAVQTAQAEGSPVYFPGDGTAWEIAKMLVNMADGNYHELVSHLGLTHLLTEPFVLATLRQLDPQHPLNALLVPHFAGTLLINYAAQTTLITDGGAVDKLLTGTIASARELSANAVKAVRYNGSFFPMSLAERGVDDTDALPDYPYRDDALALWQAIHAWVTEYVSVYYPTDGDVIGDYELQAWVQELATDGKIQDIGEGAPGAPASIATASYLATLLTQVIFTGSVQHAAVNFPQRTIMSFTPAMPLAAYAPFPAAEGEPATEILDVLPPLQQSLLQQAVGTALGGVYHTRLGAYGGQLALRQVGDALARFQQRLHKIEDAINAANHLGQRTPYETLLPSAIPQSINI
ncbi:MAG: lipoxygenase family protein [Minicystis sp.]